METVEKKQGLQEVKSNGNGDRIESLALNPFDGEVSEFMDNLNRRADNRSQFLAFLEDHLKSGVDYGRIHVVGKKKCSAGSHCTNPNHFSKPSLMKPGAEKICGWLALTPTYPTLSEYERAAYSGNTIEQVVLRCELVDTHGNVVGVGVGARLVSAEHGDLNKTMKMAAKSALVDAVLRVGGLSEVYTQDVENMDWDNNDGNNETDKPQVQFDRDAFVRFGKYAKGEDGKPPLRWRELPEGYLKWLVNNANSPEIKSWAEREMNARAVEADEAANHPVFQKPENGQEAHGNDEVGKDKGNSEKPAKRPESGANAPTPAELSAKTEAVQRILDDVLFAGDREKWMEKAVDANPAELIELYESLVEARASRRRDAGALKVRIAGAKEAFEKQGRGAELEQWLESQFGMTDIDGISRMAWNENDRIYREIGLLYKKGVK